MKALLQRVKQCTVRVDEREISSIGRGLLVLLGISHEDGDKDVPYIVNKVLRLRIFDDEEGKMNLSLCDVGGDLMVVSQFTLYGDTGKGRRPSYVRAADPGRARELYESVCDAFTVGGCDPAKGEFGEHMEVELVNDGPVTIMLESPSPRS
ncbi:MAG: D-aminoacyl-tRNA deacylase [Actinomycetota bacterium]|nr:D-aminoacyl-tRNA deacylase [Actinomycetota bacterium]